MVEHVGPRPTLGHAHDHHMGKGLSDIFILVRLIGHVMPNRSARKRRILSRAQRADSGLDWSGKQT
jgi:hypothetical protein